MALDWSVLNGDPAPGSVSGVQRIAASFTKVATTVQSIIEGLGRAGGGRSIEGWRGAAADAFHMTLASVPLELEKAVRSYREAAAALVTYAGVLESCQADALAARNTAEQSMATQASAVSARGRAADHVAALERQKRQATSDHQQAVSDHAAAIEPAVAAAGAARVQATTARLNSLNADLAAAKAERDRQDRAANDAKAVVDAQREKAERTRTQVCEAAATASRALAAAEKNAQLPDWLTRQAEDARGLVATYGDVFVDSFDKGASWFGIAAKVFPLGAPVFLAFSAVFGAAALCTDLAVGVATPWGLTGERLWHSAGEAVMAVSAVVGLRAVGAGMQEAAQLAQTAEKLDWAYRGTQIGEGFARDGLHGALVTGRGMVIGYAAGVAGGKALGAGIRTLNKNSTTSAVLSQMSKKFSTLDSSQPSTRFPLCSPDQIRELQSVLTQGHVPPGGFLPGHGSPADLGSHATSNAVTDTVTKELAEPVADVVADKFAEWLDDRSSTAADDGTEGITMTLPFPTGRS